MKKDEHLSNKEISNIKKENKINLGVQYDYKIKENENEKTKEAEIINNKNNEKIVKMEKELKQLKLIKENYGNEITKLRNE